jgi:WD40 repeat protein
LAKDPADRYPTCGAFTDALRAALADTAGPLTEVRPSVIPPATVARTSRSAAAVAGPPRGTASGDGPATRDVSRPIGARGEDAQSAGQVSAFGGSDTVDAPAGPHQRKTPRTLVSAAAALVLAGALTGTLLLWPATASRSPAAGSAGTHRSGAGTTASSGPKLGSSPVATFTTGGQDVVLLAFSPNGSLSAVDSKYNVSVFSVASRTREGAFSLGHAKIPSLIVPSWDGQQLLDSPNCAYKGSPCRTLVFDTATRRQVGSLPTIADYRTTGVSSSLFATDDSAGDGANLYDIASGSSVADLTNPDHHYVITMALSPDGKVLAVSSDGTDAMYLWDTSAQKVIGTIHTSAKQIVQSAIFSGDGKTIAVSDGTNTYVFDVGTRSLITTVPSAENWGADSTISTALSPDGKLLAYMKLDQNRHVTGVTLANARTGATIATVPAADAVGAESVAFSRDGTMLAVGRFSGQVSVWKVDR